ncbi:DUF1294 domain-containing protein [Flavobacterium sp. N2820]|uniref:DUF1294 domain-containing protein n=1 Tax=Flavobacterium sp. N2820 TaxID=2986834 RepID=UPI002223F5E5|nr:DUF1294 domain-containing protein [Flavobacterium sp. N2820]
MEPILFYLLIINLITLFVWGYDKKMARKNGNRIPEIRLLWFIFLGGLFGGIIGMLIFRHKISKCPFLLKFFVVAILQLIILRFILRILWN